MKKNQPTVITISEEEIPLDTLVKQITLPSTGAVVVFTGVVREINYEGVGRKTERLEYEAYLPMAEEKMHQVEKEMREKWQDVEGIAILQRVGKMEAGTVTTVIACSAAHRNSGVSRRRGTGLTG
jgi:molybdopterin synthase catalytic subunit